MSEINFNPNQILRSRLIEPDEETLEQRKEEIYLPNITPDELNRFAVLRERIEEKTSTMSNVDVDLLFGRLVEYSTSLKDKFGEETLRNVLLFYIVSPEESENVSGNDIERFDLEDESIESKVSEILETI